MRSCISCGKPLLDYQRLVCSSACLDKQPAVEGSKVLKQLTQYWSRISNEKLQRKLRHRAG